jgi:hypothetical protein
MAKAKEVEDLKKQESDLDDLILGKLNDVGLEKASGQIATMGINIVVTGKVEDWKTFYEYVREKDFFHLLQRRLAQPAYRELLEQHDGVPGVVPQTIRKLSLTKASK